MPVPHIRAQACAPHPCPTSVRCVRALVSVRCVRASFLCAYVRALCPCAVSVRCVRALVSVRVCPCTNAALVLLTSLWAAMHGLVLNEIGMEATPNPTPNPDTKVWSGPQRDRHGGCLRLVPVVSPPANRCGITTLNTVPHPHYTPHHAEHRASPSPHLSPRRTPHLSPCRAMPVPTPPMCPHPSHVSLLDL